jgi:cytochrome c-type biogenesis protein CcmH/NrfG
MERMDKRYLIAIIVAAIVVVALVIIIPNLGNDDDNTAVPTQDGSGASAPAISPDATMPADHPSVEGDTGMTNAAEDAYNADPKNVEAILALADIYAMAQKSDEVERLLNEALAVEPDNSQANATLAMIQFEKGDTDGAEARLIAVIDTNPDDQTALYDLGIVYFSTNQRDKAKEIWSKAAEVDPSTEFGQLASQFIQMMEQSGSTGASPHGASTPTTTQ